MLGDDLVLALQHGRPVDLDLARDVDAIFLRMLEMVVNLRVKQQRLGRNAAPQQAGAAKLFVVLISAVFSPYCPARIAAVYPAGPPPIIATSKIVSAKRCSVL